MGKPGMLDWLRSKFQGGVAIKGYEVQGVVFEGAFSNIYRAVHKERGIPIALKILTPAGAKIASMLDKNPGTHWEGELLEMLDHPNIIKCVEYSKKPPYWIAMEHIESQLPEHIGRCSNQREESDLLNILSQIVSAVIYLHDKGLIHRDICLGNILLDEGMVAKLIDFGLTVPLGSSVVRGRVGTPSYMAPEMIKKWQHTESADIYSLGVVAYELITGRKPFKGELREQRMTYSLNVNPLPPSKLGQYCSAEVEQLVMRMISKDPSKRTKSGREVEAALFLIRRRRGIA